MKHRIFTMDNHEDIMVPAGLTLLEQLNMGQIHVDSACGGNGTCHKCRVQVKSGFARPNSLELDVFSQEEVSEGWRLSCQTRPKTSLTVKVPKVESLKGLPRLVVKEIPLSNPRLVCDLGSTGVVVALGDDHENIMAEAHLLNRQVRFGADVMTRLQSAQEKGLKPLQKVLLNTLRACFNTLKKNFPSEFDQASQSPVVCSGNSAMVSFLHGYDIQSLATSPFQPACFDAAQSTLDELTLETPPLLSGFVGADTFSVLLGIEERKPTVPYLMVDIGTNCELVLRDADGQFFVASAPAGPAFEGGNIAQGMRAEPGAISKIFHNGEAFEVETIGGDIPKGICGSGLVDAIAQGLKAELIHADGFVPSKKIFLTSEIFLSADDVREFQLAKSATRTGIDMLIQKAGVIPEIIYFAGTFAEHLCVESVIRVGLLPDGIPIKAIGNGALVGSFYYSLALEGLKKQQIQHLTGKITQIELALEDEFQAQFVKNLAF